MILRTQLLQSQQMEVLLEQVVLEEMLGHQEMLQQVLGRLQVMVVLEVLEELHI